MSKINGVVLAAELNFVPETVAELSYGTFQGSTFSGGREYSASRAIRVLRIGKFVERVADDLSYEGFDELVKTILVEAVCRLRELANAFGGDDASEWEAIADKAVVWLHAKKPSVRIREKLEGELLEIQRQPWFQILPREKRAESAPFCAVNLSVTQVELSYGAEDSITELDKKLSLVTGYEKRAQEALELFAPGGRYCCPNLEVNGQYDTLYVIPQSGRLEASYGHGEPVRYHRWWYGIDARSVVAHWDGSAYALEVLHMPSELSPSQAKTLKEEIESTRKSGHYLKGLSDEQLTMLEM